MTVVPTDGMCPRCGGTNPLASGQLFERCALCGLEIVPAKTELAKGFAATHISQFRTDLERHRNERIAIANALRGSFANVIPYVVFGSFLPLTVGSALMSTIEAIQAGNGNAIVVLIVLWILVLGNIAPIVLIAWLRKRMRNRVAATVNTASSPFGPRMVGGLQGLVGWLNENWAGPIALTELSAGPVFEARAITIEDYAGLIALNPTRFSRDYPAYVVVQLAAWMPATHDGEPIHPASTARQRTELDALGFRLTIDGAGLRAFADEPVARALVQRGDGGQLLTRVATTLLAIARQHGGVPTSRLVEVPSLGA
jgi:hypothetical protein